MLAPQPQIRLDHARVIRQFARRAVHVHLAVFQHIGVVSHLQRDMARQVRFVSGTYLAGASGGTSASMEGSSFIAGLSAAPMRVRRYCR